MDGILNDEYFMRAALQEAKKAFDADEVPVGAVIVANGTIIGRAHNLTERLNDVTAHAEMMVFTSAANHLGAKFLNDCTLYVTLEPCLMCAGAAYWTRISKIVYGATDEKRGYQKTGEGILHPSTQVVGGVLEKECSELLVSYFKGKR